MAVAARAGGIGDYLREWRRRRRLSQLALALEAEISQRHLSFIESGRANPSREMVLHLGSCLDVPLRERNAMLLAAGHAPAFPEHSLEDPALDRARQAIELVLKGHEPFPALAIDRHWFMLAANDALAPLLAGVADPELLKPPVNVLRLSLHPQGLAPHIANLPEWRNHLLDRLRHQITVTSDPVLRDLMRDLLALPAPGAADRPVHDHAGVLVPLELVTETGILSFFSTTTLFGTPLDVTLAELALECFFPADEETAGILLQLAEQRESLRLRR